jgi:NTE family protein
VERASAHWFSSGSIADAVIASCAVPGLFPPAVIDGEHFLDGGMVHSIPVGRAVRLGAKTIYVLHVGRLERPLQAPRWPWQVGLVAFEIARRHRFVEEMATLTDDVTVHVLPSGVTDTPIVSLRQRVEVGARIDAAYRASRDYLG